MRIIALVIIITTSIFYSSAQDSTKNSIQLGWGFGNIMRQDSTVSPFVHSDWSPVNVQFVYSHSKKLEQRVKIKFSLYSPKPKQDYTFTSFYNGDGSTTPHSFKLIDIDYSIGKKWIEKEKLSFIAGGKSRNFIYASDYYFGETGPSPMMISFGLDIWAQINYQINKRNELKAVLSLPIMSFVYRNPYLTEDDSYHQILYSHKGLKEFGSRIAASNLRSWGNAQKIEFNLDYFYELNDRWDLGGGYFVSLTTNQLPTKFVQLENVFFLNGKIKF